MAIQSTSWGNLDAISRKPAWTFHMWDNPGWAGYGQGGEKGVPPSMQHALQSKHVNPGNYVQSFIQSLYYPLQQNPYYHSMRRSIERYMRKGSSEAAKDINLQYLPKGVQGGALEEVKGKAIGGIQAEAKKGMSEWVTNLYKFRDELMSRYLKGSLTAQELETMKAIQKYESQSAKHSSVMDMWGDVFGKAGNWMRGGG